MMEDNNLSAGSRQEGSRYSAVAQTPLIQPPRFFVDAGGVLARSIEQQLQAVRGPPAFAVQARGTPSSADGATGGWCAPSLDLDGPHPHSRHDTTPSVSSSVRRARPSSATIGGRSSSRPSSAYVQQRKQELLDSMLAPVHNLVGLTDHFIQRPHFHYRPLSATSVADELVQGHPGPSTTLSHARRHRAAAADRTLCPPAVNGRVQSSASAVSASIVSTCEADTDTDVFFDSPPFGHDLSATAPALSVSPSAHDTGSRAGPSHRTFARPVVGARARDAATCAATVSATATPQSAAAAAAAPVLTTPRTANDDGGVVGAVVTSEAHVPVRLRELVRLVRQDPSRLRPAPHPPPRRHPAPAAATTSTTRARRPARPQSAPKPTSGSTSRRHQRLPSRPGSSSSASHAPVPPTPAPSTLNTSGENLMMWLPRSFRQCEGCRTPMMPFTFSAIPGSAARTVSTGRAQRTKRGRRGRVQAAAHEGEAHAVPHGSSLLTSPAISETVSDSSARAGSDMLDIQQLIRDEVLEAFDAQERVAGRRFADGLLAELQLLGLSEDRILALLLAERHAAEARSPVPAVTPPQPPQPQQPVKVGMADAATTMTVDVESQAAPSRTDRSTSVSLAVSTRTVDGAEASTRKHRDGVEVAVQTDLSASRASRDGEESAAAHSRPKHHTSRHHRDDEDVVSDESSPERAHRVVEQKKTRHGTSSRHARQPTKKEEKRRRTRRPSSPSDSASDPSSTVSSQSESGAARTRRRRARHRRHERRRSVSSATNSTRDDDDSDASFISDDTPSTTTSSHRSSSERRRARRRKQRSRKPRRLSTSSASVSPKRRPRKDVRRKTTSPTDSESEPEKRVPHVLPLDDATVSLAVDKSNGAAVSQGQSVSPLLPHQLDTRRMLSPHLSTSVERGAAEKAPPALPYGSGSSSSSHSYHADEESDEHDDTAVRDPDVAISTDSEGPAQAGDLASSSTHSADVYLPTPPHDTDTKLSAAPPIKPQLHAPPPKSQLPREASLSENSPYGSPNLVRDNTETYTDVAPAPKAAPPAAGPKKPEWMIPVLDSTTSSSTSSDIEDEEEDTSEGDEETGDEETDNVSVLYAVDEHGESHVTISPSEAATIAEAAARAQFLSQGHSFMLLHAQLARSIGQREQMERMDIQTSFYRSRNVVEQLSELVVLENLARRYIEEDQQERWDDVTASAYQQRATIPALPPPPPPLLTAAPAVEDDEAPSALATSPVISESTSSSSARLAEAPSHHSEDTNSIDSDEEEAAEARSPSAASESAGDVPGIDARVIACWQRALEDLEKDEARARENVLFAQDFTRPLLALRIVEDEEQRMRDDVCFFEDMAYALIVHEWNVTGSSIFSNATSSSTSPVTAPAVETDVKEPSASLSTPCVPPLTAEAYESVRDETPVVAAVVVPAVPAEASAAATPEPSESSVSALEAAPLHAAAAMSEEGTSSVAEAPEPPQNHEQAPLDEDERPVAQDDAPAGTVIESPVPEEADVEADEPAMGHEPSGEKLPDQAPLTPPSVAGSCAPSEESVPGLEVNNLDAVPTDPPADDAAESEQPPHLDDDKSDEEDNSTVPPAAASSPPQETTEPVMDETDAGLPAAVPALPRIAEDVSAPVIVPAPSSSSSSSSVSASSVSSTVSAPGTPSPQATAPSNAATPPEATDAQEEEPAAPTPLAEAADPPVTAETETEAVVDDTNVTSEDVQEAALAVRTPSAAGLSDEAVAVPSDNTPLWRAETDDFSPPVAPSATTREGEPEQVPTVTLEAPAAAELRKDVAEAAADTTGADAHVTDEAPPPAPLPADDEAPRDDETPSPHASASKGELSDNEGSAPGNRRRRPPPTNRRRGNDFHLVETDEAGEVREEAPAQLDKIHSSDSNSSHSTVSTASNGSPLPARVLSAPAEPVDTPLPPWPTPPSPLRPREAGATTDTAAEGAAPLNAPHASSLPPPPPPLRNPSAPGSQNPLAVSTSSSGTHSSQRSPSDSVRPPLRYTKKRYHYTPHQPRAPVVQVVDDEDEEATAAASGVESERTTEPTPPRTRSDVDRDDEGVSGFTTPSPTPPVLIPSASPSTVATATAHREAFLRENKGVDSPLMRPATPEFVHATYRRLSKKAHAEAPLRNVDLHPSVMMLSEEDGGPPPAFPLPQRRPNKGRPVPLRATRDSTEDDDDESSDGYSSLSDEEDQSRGTSDDESPQSSSLPGHHSRPGPRGRPAPARRHDGRGRGRAGPHSPQLLPTRAIDSETVATAAKRNFNMILSTKYVTSTQDASLSSDDLQQVPMLVMKPISAFESEESNDY